MDDQVTQFDERELKDPIFKGCTRPAMKLGVPMVPLVVVFCGSFLLGVWGMFLLQSFWPVLVMGTVLIVSVVTMRGIAKKDDQRFRQIYLWLLLRLKNRNRKFWRATSYSPIRYKRR